MTTRFEGPARGDRSSPQPAVRASYRSGPENVLALSRILGERVPEPPTRGRPGAR